MKKANSIVTIAIMVLFVIHAVFGSLNLFGVSSTSLKPLAWVNIGLVVVHMTLSGILTSKALMAMKKAGRGYFKENRLFWARRISGFAIMIFIVFHITAFSSGGAPTDGAVVLKWFTTGRFICQILLVLSIAVHVISNVKPVLISLGIKAFKERKADILFFVSIILVLCAVALLVYYLRWNM